MLTKDEIMQLLSLNREKIRQFGVKKIGLFGSYVTNKQSEHSDIDFLVEFYEDQKKFDNFMDLYFFLKDIFKCEIDLKTIKSLPKNRNFTKNVLKEVEYATF